MYRLSALTAALSFVLILPANAQNTQEIGRYDKKIEIAAAKRAAAKIGDLRGLILSEDENPFGTRKDLAPKPGKETSLFPSTDSEALQPDNSPLPPMVMNNAIDLMATGSINRNNIAPAGISAAKFDAMGQPMANHQVYPRPTAYSAILSVFEAMSINPISGTE